MFTGGLCRRQGRFCLILEGSPEKAAEGGPAGQRMWGKNLKIRPVGGESGRGEACMGGESIERKRPRTSKQSGTGRPADEKKRRLPRSRTRGRAAGLRRETVARREPSEKTGDAVCCLSGRLQRGSAFALDFFSKKRQNARTVTGAREKRVVFPAAESVSVFRSSLFKERNSYAYQNRCHHRPRQLRP